MNKFIKFEKRFDKIMDNIEKLTLNQLDKIGGSKNNDLTAGYSLSENKSDKLSERITELEMAAKNDGHQIDKLIDDLQSLLERKHD